MFTSLTKTKRGFTLIELLIVIAIIGILSSVVLASLGQAREKSRDAKRISDLGQVQLALELVFDSKQGYPVASSTTLNGTGVTGDNGIPCSLGPQTAVKCFPAHVTANAGFGFIPKIPTPTGAGAAANYTYVGVNSTGGECLPVAGPPINGYVCNGYALGAQLERTDSPSLANDADQTVGTFFYGGSDTCTAVSAGPERCYDIKP